MLHQLTGNSRYLSDHRNTTNQNNVQISTYNNGGGCNQKDASLSESDDGGFFSYLTGAGDQDEFSSQLSRQENEGENTYFGQGSENHSAAVCKTSSDSEHSMNCLDDGRNSGSRSNNKNEAGENADTENRCEKTETERKNRAAEESRKEEDQSKQKGYGLADKRTHPSQGKLWKTDKEEMLQSKFHPGPLGRPIESSANIEKGFSVSSITGIRELRLEEIPGLKSLRCGRSGKGLPVVMIEIDSKKMSELTLKLELTSSGGLAVSMQTQGNGELPPELRDRLLKALKEADVELESLEMQGRGQDLSEGEREKRERAYMNPSAEDDLQVDETRGPLSTLHSYNSNVRLFGKKSLENYLPVTIKNAIISLHERGCFSSGSPRSRVD